MSDAGTASFNHDVKLGDNSKAIFGDGNDLQIYHDGNDSYVTDEGDGTLIIRGSTAVRITNVGGDNMFQELMVEQQSYTTLEQKRQKLQVLG